VTVSSSNAKMHLRWEIAPFCRRFQGWRLGQILWWLWPVRWVVVVRSGDGSVTTYDYFATANDAAVWMVGRKRVRPDSYFD
jgi:hypothetical protein